MEAVPGFPLCLSRLCPVSLLLLGQSLVLGGEDGGRPLGMVWGCGLGRLKPVAKVIATFRMGQPHVSSPPSRSPFTVVERIL